MEDDFNREDLDLQSDYGLEEGELLTSKVPEYDDLSDFDEENKIKNSENLKIANRKKNQLEKELAEIVQFKKEDENLVRKIFTKDHRMDLGQQVVNCTNYLHSQFTNFRDYSEHYMREVEKWNRLRAELRKTKDAIVEHNEKQKKAYVEVLKAAKTARKLLQKVNSLKQVGQSERDREVVESNLRKNWQERLAQSSSSSGSKKLDGSETQEGNSGNLSGFEGQESQTKNLSGFESHKSQSGDLRGFESQKLQNKKKLQGKKRKKRKVQRGIFLKYNEYVDDEEEEVRSKNGKEE